MVVILDIFPPEEEIVEDVDDILDFFKPKVETPLEATSSIPVDTPVRCVGLIVKFVKD